MAALPEAPSGPAPLAPDDDTDGLQTLWVSLEHRRHPEVAVLWGTLARQPFLESGAYLDVWHKLYLKLDETVARHAVAKVAGGTGGFILAAGIFGASDAQQSCTQLLTCGLELLRAVRDSIQLADGQPAELQLGMHVGPAWSGMLGTSPPHYQLIGAAVEGATSLGKQGLADHVQVSRAVVERLGGTGAISDCMAIGNTTGRWTCGGWLPLYDVETSQVFLQSERQYSGRLADAFVGREADGAGLVNQTPALQGPTLLGTSLEQRFHAQQDMVACTLERTLMSVVAPAAVLWLASRFRARGAADSREVTAVALLTACTVLALTQSCASSTRGLRWCAVQVFVMYSLVSALLRGEDPARLCLAATCAHVYNAVAQRVRFSAHLWSGFVLAAAAFAMLAMAQPFPGGTAGLPAATAVAISITVPGLLVYFWDAQMWRLVRANAKKDI